MGHGEARGRQRAGRRRPAGSAGAAGLALALALPLGGCSADEPFGGVDIAPTASPSATVTPLAQAPVGSREVTGRGWSMAVPGEWEERRRVLTPEGEVARWSERGRDGAPQVVVSVVVDRGPVEPLLEQSYRLEQRLREEDRRPVRSVVRRTDVEEPGVLVQWQENSRGDEQRREVWQLFLPGPEGSILNVVGYAPVETFTASRVPEVMGTFEVLS